MIALRRSVDSATTKVLQRRHAGEKWLANFDRYSRSVVAFEPKESHVVANVKIDETDDAIERRTRAAVGGVEAKEAAIEFESNARDDAFDFEREREEMTFVGAVAQEKRSVFGVDEQSLGVGVREGTPVPSALL